MEKKLINKSITRLSEAVQMCKKMNGISDEIILATVKCELNKIGCAETTTSAIMQIKDENTYVATYGKNSTAKEKDSV